MTTDPVSDWAERMDEGGPHVENFLRVGFVGVGVIVTAMVDALMSGPHADEIDIVFHPDLRLEAPNLRRGTVKSVSHRIINW